MTTALICGAGVGLGVLLVIFGLFPRRGPLSVALERLHGNGQSRPGGSGFGTVGLIPKGAYVDGGAESGTAGTGGVAARIGRPFARHLRGLPLLARRVQSDLAVVGRAPERHLAEKVTLALTGLLIVPAFAGLLALEGTTVAWELPVWFAILIAAGAFFVPDLGIHTEAKKRRADFRHALGSFLDLVVIALAGGAGVEGALAEAAAIGHGWAFAHLRRALEEARLTRTAPWGPLGRLGDELGIEELSELAATVSLAGAEGLADAQATAEAMSERMSLPVVVLFAGFLVFVGYPALAHVLTGL